jgi:hypothetical protein
MAPSPGNIGLLFPEKNVIFQIRHKEIHMYSIISIADISNGVTTRFTCTKAKRTARPEAGIP